MPGIVLNLMGPPKVALPHGSPAHEVRASKCLALLVFLALERRPHTREELATLLWGDSPDEAARASLRQALKQLRTAIGDALRCDRQSIELVADVASDVADFLSSFAERPAEAARFDVPHFMADFTVPHAPAFDEWLERTRATLGRKYTQALRASTREAMATSRWREAARAAARWLEYEPLSDEAVRLAVEAEYMAGDRDAALARLAAHRERMSRELHTPPSPALEALRRRIELDGHTHAATASPGSEPVPSFHADLIGRESHWRSLTVAWQAAARGAGRVVLLEGDVGVGKTRLAEEFLRWARAEGATIIRGRGYDSHTGIPYGPVVEALRDALEAPGLAGTAPEWLTEVTRLLPELRRRFPGLPEAAAPVDAAERWRLPEGVAQVLLALAAEHPLALFIDDLQWCDGDTCALLHYLARRIETAPILLVATVRLADVEHDAPAARLCRSLRTRSQASVITVGPLAEDEIWRLVRALGRLGSPNGARRFAGRLHSVTDGNPFHVIELLKTLFTQGLLAVDPVTGEWTAAQGPEQATESFPMPPTVRDAIAERVARLPYKQRDLLATIAVAGSGCRPALLSHVHGISRLQAAALCDALVERLLLQEEGGVYHCAHPVIADVMREGLTASRGREVHRAIAFSLEAVTPDAAVGEVAGQIARHADRGHERATAYHYALLASAAAVRRYAFDEALSWLDMAAGVADEGEQVDTVNRQTADVLGLAGWTEPPSRPKRAGTPARGLAQIDLDLC